MNHSDALERDLHEVGSLLRNGDSIAGAVMTTIKTCGAPDPVTRPDGASDKRRSRRAIPLIASLTVVAACALLVILLWPTDSAFAQVLKNIADAKTATFTISVVQPNKRPLTGRAIAQSPNLLRIEWKDENGATKVNILRQDELVSFSNATHVQSREAEKSVVAGEDLPQPEVRISAIRPENNFDIVSQLKMLRARHTTRLSDATNAIPDTELYAFQKGPLVGQMWVDDETSLPLKVIVRIPEDHGGGRKIYDNLQWNVAVDESIFRIPAGRTVVRSNLLAEPTEAELVAALRLRQAFSHAPYPAEFLKRNAGRTIGRLAYDPELSVAQNQKRQLEKLRPILHQIGIAESEAMDSEKLQRRIDYLCMKADQWGALIDRYGDWVGNGVTPGESRPLCWWRLPDQPTRVLYADLSIRDAEDPNRPE